MPGEPNVSNKNDPHVAIPLLWQALEMTNQNVNSLTAAVKAGFEENRQYNEAIRKDIVASNRPRTGLYIGLLSMALAGVPFIAVAAGWFISSQVQPIINTIQAESNLRQSEDGHFKDEIDRLRIWRDEALKQSGRQEAQLEMLRDRSGSPFVRN